jgi:hypothetical protein
LSGLLGQGWDEEEGCGEGKVNSAAPAKLLQHNMNDTLEFLIVLGLVVFIGLLVRKAWRWWRLFR